MRILFSSHVFAPSIGGLETVSGILAREFVRQGHAVQVITQTPAATFGAGPASEAFTVWRQPGAARLLDLIRWSEVCFHNNVSLARAWPLLLVRRPWVVAHHVWIPRHGVAARLKRAALRLATGISVSSAIAGHLATASTVIPNPYDDGQFRILPGVARSRDLVFLGRLVSDKGVATLLEAVAALAARNLRPTLTIAGDGPELAALRRQAADSGIDARVEFAGAVSGAALVALLNAHRFIVIPSLWPEPFGVVALEGMACGCVPVGSAGGGLSDAMGECGVRFANGDAGALAAALESVLSAPARAEALRQRIPDHLRRHTRAAVADAYLGVLASALATHRDQRSWKPIL